MISLFYIIPISVDFAQYEIFCAEVNFFLQGWFDMYYCILLHKQQCRTLLTAVH